MQKGEFTEVSKLCLAVEKIDSDLEGLSNARKREREELVKNSNVPDYLLDAFNGDLECTLQFMKNAENIPTRKLDEHILRDCGRARVGAHLEDLGGPDFFCGADPNNVKSYVYDYHFGNSKHKEDKPNKSDEPEIGSFGGIMADALRRAGLSK